MASEPPILNTRRKEAVQPPATSAFLCLWHKAFSWATLHNLFPYRSSLGTRADIQPKGWVSSAFTLFTLNERNFTALWLPSPLHSKQVPQAPHRDIDRSSETPSHIDLPPRSFLARFPLMLHWADVCLYSSTMYLDCYPTFPIRTCCRSFLSLFGLCSKAHSNQGF